MSLQKMSPHFSCTADPTCCTGNGIYSSFRNNRNFWLEYSTPPTTRYPEYEEDFFDSVQGAASSSTSRPPGPHFLTANHSRLQSPVGATTFLHCQVDDLKDLQVRCCIKFFPDFFLPAFTCKDPSRKSSDSSLFLPWSILKHKKCKKWWYKLSKMWVVWISRFFFFVLCFICQKVRYIANWQIEM